MGGVLDVVALRTLTSIADSGGFRRAAQSMHLSQSAVSQHVRRLEQACGRTLVERHGRTTRFTVDGELLLADARRILAAHDDALTRLRADPSTTSDLVVGSTEHAADLLLPVISARLQSDFPGRRLRFRIDRGAKLNERLDDGLIDACLLIGDQRGRDVRPAGALPLRWYAKPGWLPPDDGAPVPLVVIDGPCTIRATALAALAARGIATEIVCEAGHLAGVIGAARAGVGVALLAGLAGPEGLTAVAGLPQVRPEPLHVRGRDAIDPGVVDAIAEVAAGLTSRA